MISKEKFVGYMAQLEDLDIVEYNLNSSLEKIFGTYNSAGLYIYEKPRLAMIKMLCDLMDIEYNHDDLYGDDIQYFVYELDFGKSKSATSAVEVNGKTYDLSSAEKFYDYLVEMKNID